VLEFAAEKIALEPKAATGAMLIQLGSLVAFPTREVPLGVPSEIQIGLLFWDAN
jgi:hypothetical protein